MTPNRTLPHSDQCLAQQSGTNTERDLQRDNAQRMRPMGHSTLKKSPPNPSPQASGSSAEEEAECKSQRGWKPGLQNTAGPQLS